MSRLHSWLAGRSIPVRRVVMWTVRTAVAGFVTGLIVGVGISLAFSRAPFWAYLLAWGLGAGIGLSAGIASGPITAALAVIIARSGPLSRRDSAITSLVGTYAVLGFVYGFDASQNEQGFVVFMTLVAGAVSAGVNRHTDSMPGFGSGPIERPAPRMLKVPG